MICFTCDLDWAHDEVLADTLELFYRNGIPCTFFATHPTSVFAGCDPSLVEISVHPNLNPLLAGGHGPNAEQVIADLKALYPQALGLRCHSLTHSSVLLDILGRLDFEYESNLLLPYQTNIRPFRAWNGVVRIPHNWEDDVHFLYGFGFDNARLDFSEPLLVLDFHPIHLFLNTEKQARYEGARPWFQSPRHLRECRNRSGIPGARDLLLSLFRVVKEKRLLVSTALDLARRTPPLA